MPIYVVFARIDLTKSRLYLMVLLTIFEAFLYTSGHMGHKMWRESNM